MKKTSSKKPRIFSTLTGKWFHYEGMHNKTTVYDSAAFDDDCPSHECWNEVLRIPELSADTRVSDALLMLKEALKVKDVEINLRNDKFVDIIVSLPSIPSGRGSALEPKYDLLIIPP